MTENLNGLNLWITPEFPLFFFFLSFFLSVFLFFCKTNWGGCKGHLGLVMAKLAKINFNLETEQWSAHGQGHDKMEGEFYCGPYCPKLDKLDGLWMWKLYVGFTVAQRDFSLTTTWSIFWQINECKFAYWSPLWGFFFLNVCKKGIQTA